jgi:hypothetical protein
MEEEKKNIEQVKNKKITVTCIELESNPNNENQINKFRFKTDIGDITWKPKIDKIDYINGLKRISKIPMDTGNIPPFIVDIGKIIGEKTKVIIEGVSYMVMKTKDAEGDDVTYRFFTSEKYIESWKIVQE